MFEGEIIEKDGKKYRRQFARTIDRFIVGCDIAQSNDFTAIAVVHHSTRALETWTAHDPKDRNCVGRLVQDVETFFHLRALERMPLGVPYPDQVKRVEQILSHPRLRDAALVVD